MSRFEMGRRLAVALGADPGLVVPNRQADFPAPEPRPRDVSLDSSRWRTGFPTHPWPGWEEALAELGVGSSSEGSDPA
jgi:dTDP-4-dehydrorhamnose reductase